MQKLEKIIQLFSLFYYFKYFKICNKFSKGRAGGRNFSVHKLNYKTFNFKKFKLLFCRKIIWFLNNFKKKKNLVKDFLYFCVKLKFRVLIMSIYFKKRLLFNISRPFKKAVRSYKKLEKIYKKKNLLFGVKRKKRKRLKFTKLRKKNRIKKNRMNYIGYATSLLVKFASFFNVYKIIICVFKSNIYVRKFRGKRLYQKRKHKIFKIKLIRNLKKILNLVFYKNLKLDILLSNNFSHSSKFLKLKKKRS